MRSFRFAQILPVVLLLAGVMARADGLSTWHLRYATRSNDSTIAGIAFGNGQFVAPLVYPQSPYAPSILRSVNGSQWARYVPLGSASFDSVSGKFVNGWFFFRGSASTDGLNWVQSGAPNRFAFNGSYFIGEFNVSTNGLQWTPVGAPNLQVNDTAFGRGLFVNVGSSYPPQASVIWTSPDGFIWTYQREMPGEAIHHVVFGNGRFVASAYYANKGVNLVSTDGLAWNTVSNVPPAWEFLNGQFLGPLNETNFSTSVDGISWTTNNFAPDRFLRAITFGSGTYVAVAWNGTNYSHEIWQSDPITNAPPVAPGLSVATYPGLTVTGSVGSPHRIEYRSNLEPTNTWHTLTNTTLPMSPWLFIDTQATTGQSRFYRAVAE